MTLDQVFPGLAGAPDGSIVAAADHMLDVTGPADRMMAEVFEDQSKQSIAQIKAIDPRWVYYRLGPIDSVEGLRNEYNYLRFQRAVTLARVKDDYGPLQVETLRFVQERTDSAYEEGLAPQKAGKLKSLPSDPVALGNFIDGRVRYDLRLHYNQFGIDSAGRGPVRVNRREDDTSGTDLTYRRPDARVKDVAFDVTIAHKTLKTAQVRGFFNTDFQPAVLSLSARVSLVRATPMSLLVRRPNDGYLFLARSVPEPQSVYSRVNQRDQRHAGIHDPRCTDLHR